MINKFTPNLYCLTNEMSNTRKKMPHDLEGITYEHGVPQVVFVCWFGRLNEFPKMSKNRQKAWKSLVSELKVPVILLTPRNYKQFEVDSHPIHRSFKYLSANHKSDYLRAYMLHHLGGGITILNHGKGDGKTCGDILRKGMCGSYRAAKKNHPGLAIQSTNQR